MTHRLAHLLAHRSRRGAGFGSRAAIAAIRAQMKYIPAPASSASRRATSAIVVWPKTLRREVTPSAQIPPASSASWPILPSRVWTTSRTVISSAGPGERVAAFHPPVGGQEAAAAQGREELLEELLGHPAALGDLFDRDRPVARARQLGHRDDGVAGLRGDRDHAVFSTARARTRLG